MTARFVRSPVRRSAVSTSRSSISTFVSMYKMYHIFVHREIIARGRPSGNSSKRFPELGNSSAWTGLLCEEVGSEQFAGKPFDHSHFHARACERRCLVPALM